jgi:hypothetical protein
MERMKIKLLCTLLLLLAYGMASGQSKLIDPEYMARANTFIHKNAPSSFYSIKTMEKKTIDNDLQILLVELSPKGFILMSTDSIKPIWAFSFENNFKTQPDNLRVSETLLVDISHQKPEITHKKKQSQQELLGPYVQTLWGQVNCYDKYNHLINVTNYYTPNHYAAGCVAISMSTLLHFYQWPIEGIGSYTDNDNNGTSTGSYSADFSKTAYDWANMLNRYRYKSSTLEERKAAGELAYQVAIALNMDFEANGSTSNVNRIPSAGKKYFRFSGVERSPSSNVFWPMLDSNIAHGIPVIFAVKADNGAGHSIVCDGLKIDDNGDYYYHLNMGWWGDSNGWYRIRDTWNSGGYTSITDAVFYFLPIPELSTPYVKLNDEKGIIRWSYPAKVQVEAFELQQKTDDGAWISMDNSIQDTFYTVDVHPDEQQYFRLRAKVAGRWPFDDWSNVEKISMDASSVNEFSGCNPITISPNPVSDKLNIQFGTKILSAEVTIFDLNGKKLIRKKPQKIQSGIALNVEALKKGIYFIRINEGNNKIKTLKFIKN